MLKIVLLVALVPLVLGSPEEMMKMMKMMKMMEGEGRGGSSGEMGEQMGGGSSEEMGGQMGGGEGRQHEEGDGDCESKKEAMKKNFMLFQKMQKMKAMMEKKQEMEETMEKMKKFKAFSEMMEKKKQQEEMEKKQMMWKMMQKQMEERKKEEKENEFKELVESFTQQKTKFAFGLTHQFLTMCRCGEIDYQMNQMFMGERMSNSSAMAEGMDEQGLMDAWASGDKALVAQKLKAMPKEAQKKLYMAGLIKSMCGGARTFINYSKQFEEQYMMDAPTTASPSN